MSPWRGLAAATRSAHGLFRSVEVAVVVVVVIFCSVVDRSTFFLAQGFTVYPSYDEERIRVDSLESNEQLSWKLIGGKYFFSDVSRDSLVDG